MEENIETNVKTNVGGCNKTVNKQSDPGIIIGRFIGAMFGVFVVGCIIILAMWGWTKLWHLLF